MVVEVDEDIAALGNLAAKIQRGPQRKAFLKLAAEADPELVVAELEADKAIAAATKPLTDKIAQLEADNMKNDVSKRLEDRRKPVAHLSKEELASLEQFMIDKGVSNYEIALREKQRLDQVATPRPAGRFGRAEMPTADKDNMLYKDPAGFRSKTLHSMIDDLQNGKTI
jgi:hypothetical protein